ncbi:MAG: hypothetical protein E5W96_36485 [Mesorhizobium sp.]|nr:MAG: hypothetical protein E5W96_36485 [Mesorhizobium sp.]
MSPKATEGVAAREAPAPPHERRRWRLTRGDPLCPAGHLPLKEGDWLSRRLSPIAALQTVLPAFRDWLLPANKKGRHFCRPFRTHYGTGLLRSPCRPCHPCRRRACRPAYRRRLPSSELRRSWLRW